MELATCAYQPADADKLMPPIDVLQQLTFTCTSVSGHLNPQSFCFGGTPRKGTFVANVQLPLCASTIVFLNDPGHNSGVQASMGLAARSGNVWAELTSALKGGPNAACITCTIVKFPEISRGVHVVEHAVCACNWMEHGKTYIFLAMAYLDEHSAICARSWLATSDIECVHTAICRHHFALIAAIVACCQPGTCRTKFPSSRSYLNFHLQQIDNSCK